MKLNRQILKANEEAYRALNRGYLDGNVSYLELITSLQDLYSSRSQEQTLYFEVLKLRAELAYYQGTVNEVLQIQ